MKSASTHARTTVRLLTFLVGVVMAFGAAYAAPTLVIPNDTFDFGFVPQQSEISHEFWLHSVGDDMLKILKVVPG
jgi:hypothetical protein